MGKVYGLHVVQLKPGANARRSTAPGFLNAFSRPSVGGRTRYSFTTRPCSPLPAPNPERAAGNPQTGILTPARPRRG